MSRTNIVEAALSGACERYMYVGSFDSGRSRSAAANLQLRSHDGFAGCCPLRFASILVRVDADRRSDVVRWRTLRRFRVSTCPAPACQSPIPRRFRCCFRHLAAFAEICVRPCPSGRWRKERCRAVADGIDTAAYDLTGVEPILARGTPGRFLTPASSPWRGARASPIHPWQGTIVESRMAK
jgi:hypothetical protein